MRISIWAVFRLKPTVSTSNWASCENKQPTIEFFIFIFKVKMMFSSPLPKQRIYLGICHSGAVSAILCAHMHVNFSVATALQMICLQLCQNPLDLAIPKQPQVSQRMWYHYSITLLILLINVSGPSFELGLFFFGKQLQKGSIKSRLSSFLCEENVIALKNFLSEALKIFSWKNCDNSSPVALFW